MQRDDNRMLDHSTTYTEEQAAKRGKLSNTGETLTTVDIPTSDVVKEWETVNDKALTTTRPEYKVDFDFPEGTRTLDNGDIDSYQEDMAISGNKIYGKLKCHHVTGDYELMDYGYYLMLHIPDDPNFTEDHKYAYAITLVDSNPGETVEELKARAIERIKEPITVKIETFVGPDYTPKLLSSKVYDISNVEILDYEAPSENP